MDRVAYSTTVQLRAPTARGTQSKSNILTTNTTLSTLSTLPAADIVGVRFSLATSDDIKYNSVVQVTEVARDAAGHAPRTVQDAMLGVSRLRETCGRCGMGPGQCGHKGHIEFGTYFAPPETNLMAWLKFLIGSICGGCGRPILSDKLLERIYTNMVKARGEMQEAEWHIALLEAIDKDSKNAVCDYTALPHGKDPRDQYIRTSLTTNASSFNTPAVVTGKFGSYEVTVDLEFYHKALGLLTQKQLKYFGFTDLSGDTLRAHPQALITTNMAVIPVCSRAPIYKDNGVVFHDITKQYNRIVDAARAVVGTNTLIQDAESRGDRSAVNTLKARRIEQIQKLNFVYQTFYKEQYSGLLAKKTGIIRQEGQGKTVAYTGRGTVTPGATLRVGDIGVPRKAAQTSTVREVVIRSNIAHLSDMLKEGRVKYVYPVTATIDNAAVRVLPHTLPYIRLQIGDGVDREMEDGDYIITIRQPSLSGLSIIGGRVVIHEGIDFRVPLEETVVRAMDFDGDQVNYVVVQTQAGRDEVASFMRPENTLISPKDNNIIFGSVQDALVGASIMTLNPLKQGEKPTLDKGWVSLSMFERFVRLCSDTCNSEVSEEGLALGITSKREDFLRRLEKHGMVFSIEREPGEEPVVPSDVALSWTFPPVTYKNAVVTVRDGIIVAGVVNKVTIGLTHDTIIQNIAKTMSRERAIDFLTDVSRVATSFTSFYGVSVGMKDCAPQRADTQLRIGEILTDMAMAIERIELPKNSDDNRRYQSELENVINEYSGKADKLVIDGLGPDNRLMTIIKSGAKGTEKQLANAVGVIGQQYIAGSRPEKQLTGGTRYSWYFSEDDLEPTSMGMCTSSLEGGITPAEAIYVGSAARFSFINIGTNTSDIGKNGRNMYRTCQGMTSNKQGAVVYDKKLVSTLYGGDGLDPTRLQRVKGANGLELHFANLQHIADQMFAERGWYRD